MGSFPPDPIRWALLILRFHDRGRYPYGFDPLARLRTIPFMAIFRNNFYNDAAAFPGVTAIFGRWRDAARFRNSSDRPIGQRF